LNMKIEYVDKELPKHSQFTFCMT